MSEAARREELRRFLKARRAQLRPADVGLPATARRRVPGLRREEVASLAGIGVSWYTALENGDASGVSEATVTAVADALRLTAAEREYLIQLVHGAPPFDPLETADSLVIATMDALGFPAYVVTPEWNVLACNAAFRRVWGVGAEEVPFNAAERLFIEPVARAMHGARFVANVTPVIAMLRSASGRRPDSAVLQHLRERILADDLTRPIWNSYAIEGPLSPNACTIDSPVGTFRYEALTLPVPGTLLAIVIHVPDAPSRERLDAP